MSDEKWAVDPESASRRGRPWRRARISRRRSTRPGSCGSPNSVEAGMTPARADPVGIQFAERRRAGRDGRRQTLFVNYLGHIFAVDLKSGKMLWRSASFHNLEVLAQQNMARMLDTGRFAIVAAGEHVWALARDMKDQNFFAPFQLICRRADNGEVVWKSADLPDYATFDLVGLPLLADGKLFIAAKTQANPQQRQGLPQQFVLAIQPHDGKVLWKTEVGTFRQGQQFFYYYMRDTSPQPRLVYRAGAVYLDTHVGVLARLDADSGAFDWGYGYKTDAVSVRAIASSITTCRRSPRPSAARPSQTGEAFLDQGDAVRAALCRRAQPDEGPLGAADHQGLAAARRRRQRRLSGRRRAERRRSEDAEALVGDARAQRQHGRAAFWCGRTASGN